MTDEITLGSHDVLAERVNILRQEFPEVFTEGKIDFEALRRALGDEVVTDRERYGLSWAGKSEAVRNIQTPSVATLVPDREESVEFDSTENMFIEGDNLEILKILQKSYHGQVKMIYIDPPYNTGNEFIYPDNFREGIKDYLRYSGQVDDNSLKLSTNTETSGRYHSKWLNMMYPRLFLARNLLREDGVIFVSIDDHEIHNLYFLLDEIFGEENWITTITWEKGRKNDSTFFSESVEYMLVYGRSREILARQGPWRETKQGFESIMAQYQTLRAEYGSQHDLIEAGMRAFYASLDNSDPRKQLKHFFRSDDRGLYFGADISSASTSIPDYDILHPSTNLPVKKPSRGWGATEEVMLQRISEDRVLFGPDESTIPLKKSYLVLRHDR